MPFCISNPQPHLCLRCYPISIISKALPLSNLTGNWISAARSISASLLSAPSLFSCPLSRMSLPFWQCLLISFQADPVCEAQAFKATSVPAGAPRHQLGLFRRTYSIPVLQLAACSRGKMEWIHGESNSLAWESLHPAPSSASGAG